MAGAKVKTFFKFTFPPCEYAQKEENFKLILKNK
jgi:hypothetical protein